jgi:hypothetical protein
MEGWNDGGTQKTAEEMTKGRMEEWYVGKGGGQKKNLKQSRKHESTKARKKTGLYRTIGPFSCFPIFVLS